ncbi:MAG: peptide chain release factor N(5)-glutamine methyltransferase [Chitinophagaceae bacterium]|uniref:peptide chain release factor N(5)-glutamine methyltransferase n=1 Tax=unclassified Paraflavitalea TaxID=2798305 RepID=UPI003D33C7BC|nr:peptide chain release factor N(5)-glutamine methyltransferase [Chitinophagaceae bacterium]
MTTLQARQQLLQVLFDRYPDREASIMADMVIEKLTGFPKIEQILNKQLPLLKWQEEQLEAYLKDLSKGRPVQYVLGEAWFYGLQLTVNEAVLIPRPETEELVDWIVKDVKKGNSGTKRILDIGTGSGCIALGIKKGLPAAEVVGMDLSAEALDVAKLNAASNSLAVQWVEDSILNPQQELGTFDIIVSNPPYITAAEKDQMLPHVLDFEPHLALFVYDQDPLLFYKAIYKYSKTHLNAGGALYFEINEQMGGELKRWCLEQGASEVEIKRDMQGKERMVRVG